nr:hypothetical protein [Saccharofermentans sp.]
MPTRDIICRVPYSPLNPAGDFKNWYIPKYAQATGSGKAAFLILIRTTIIRTIAIISIMIPQVSL